MGANLTFSDGDDVQLKGATDGTLIGNTSNRLLVDSTVSPSNDSSGTGSLTALDSTVAVSTQGRTTIIFNTNGTWVGTIRAEGLIGSTWILTTATDGSQSMFATATSNSQWILNAGGYSQVRLRMSLYTSGTATVDYNVGLGGHYIQAWNTNSASHIVRARLQDVNANSITTTILSGTAANKIPVDVALLTPALNYYSLPIRIRQTSAAAAGVTVFAMRNVAAGTKTVYIDRIHFSMAYDTATPLGRSTPSYEIARFSTATPTAGTASTVILMDTSNAATQVTDARFLDTGLTTTSVVFEGPMAIISLPAVDGSITQYQRQNVGVKLAPGEGLCIRVNVAMVIGISLSGEIVWSER